LKGYKRKLGFGIPMTVLLVGAGIFMLSTENPESMFVPIVFVFAFAGGLVYWLVINYRESIKRKEENFRRKYK